MHGHFYVSCHAGIRLVGRLLNFNNCINGYNVYIFVSPRTEMEIACHYGSKSRSAKPKPPG